jgi:hypothetical protein
MPQNSAHGTRVSHCTTRSKTIKKYSGTASVQAAFLVKDGRTNVNVQRAHLALVNHDLFDKEAERVDGTHRRPDHVETRLIRRRDWNVPSR